MVGYILKKSLAVLAKKPIMLWGVSLMYVLLVWLVSVVGAITPIISLPITLTLGAGMAALFLDGYNGKPISSKQLFTGFKKENIVRVTGGMCWYWLWIIIWFFVPFVGLITGIYKMLSYSFTPYILITRPEISAMDALKVSMQETKGYKLMMFLTALLIALAIIVASVLLATITVLVPFFGIIYALFTIALMIFLPLFCGIISAAFYQEAKNGVRTTVQYGPPSYNQGGYVGSAYGSNTYNPNPPSNPYTPPVSPEPEPVSTPDPTPDNGDWYCTECGTLNAAGTFYCRACGKKNGE